MQQKIPLHKKTKVGQLMIILPVCLLFLGMICTGCGIKRHDENELFNNYDLGSLEYEEPIVSKDGQFSYTLSKDKTAILQGYEGIDKDIIIPDIIDGHEVETIGEEAFYFCEKLVNVEIPNSVKTIGDCAFWGCTNLNNIIVSDDNEYYEDIDGVLFEKESKTLVVYPNGRRGDYSIPDGTIYIGDWAFCYCENLDNIEMPDSITKIGYKAFEGCKNLRKIKLSNNMTTIGNDAFWGCESLSSIELPDSIVEIGNAAFEKCSSLNDIELPDNVAMIGYGVFSSCTNLKKIIVSDDNDNFTDINGVLYDKERKSLLAYPAGRADISYSVPDGTVSIGNRAFGGCWNLNYLELPDSIITIDGHAFWLAFRLKGFRVHENSYAHRWAEKYAKDIGMTYEVLP